KNDILDILPEEKKITAFPDPENPNALRVNWNELYDYIQKIDVTVDTTISKDEFTDEKRSDLQDALTVMKQTANPNDPNAMNRISVVEDELLDETVPDIAQKLQTAHTPATPAQMLDPTMVM